MSARRVWAGWVVTGAALGISGCNPQDPLPDGSGPGDGEGSVILTRSNHNENYGRLSCFVAGCHTNRDNRWNPVSHPDRKGRSCTDAACHGNNGVFDRTLAVGQVFADTLRTMPQPDVLVRAIDVSQPEIEYRSERTDNDGFFSLEIATGGAFNWVLEGLGGDEVRSEERGMAPTTVSGGSTASLDCSSCHDGKTAPPLVYDP